MTFACRTTRRGAALLLVLATLVLVTTASVSLLRLAATAKIADTSARQRQIADDLLAAAEAPILDWLAGEAGDVVLGPDVAEPRVSVAQRSWTVDGVLCELELTAWDQAGMVPIQRARSGSPMRLALPESIQRVLDRTPAATDHPLGLDLLDTGTAELPVFPRSGKTEPVAVGSLAATHNADVINVNTAPEQILDAALRVAGRGGIEAIMGARDKGTAFPAADLPDTGTNGDRSLRLTAASNAWSIRIDVRVGVVRRSWWVVYVAGGSTLWECVQRLAIER